MYPNLTPTLVGLLGIALAVAGFIAVRRPFLRRLALRQIAAAAARPPWSWSARCSARRSSSAA